MFSWVISCEDGSKSSPQQRNSVAAPAVSLMPISLAFLLMAPMVLPPLSVFAPIVIAIGHHRRCRRVNIRRRWYSINGRRRRGRWQILWLDRVIHWAWNGQTNANVYVGRGCRRYYAHCEAERCTYSHLAVHIWPCHDSPHQRSNCLPDFALNVGTCLFAHSRDVTFVTNCPETTKC